ncbi:MAG: ATP synthase F1 subunit delta [Bacteroidota bacterium]
MKIIKVAHRYAKALYDFAVENNAQNKVLDDVLLVRKTIEHKEFKNMMVSQIIPAAKKASAIEALFGNHVQPLTLAFLKLIVMKNRAQAVPQISIEYEQIYNLKNNILATEIESVVALQKNIRKQFIEALKAQTQASKVNLTEKVNRDLIGGFVLRYQNQQYDASIRKQLSELRKTLT